MQEFLSMGGYGTYVWTSYGLTALVMAVLLVASIRSLKSTETTFERLKLATAPRQEQKEQQTETQNGDEA